MAKRFRVRPQEIASLVVAAAGLLAVVLTTLPYDPQSFAAPYIQGTQGTGWMAMLLGGVWLALAAAHGRTRYFALNERLSSELFGATIAALAVAVIVLLILVIPQLPRTPPDRLPPDPAMRETLLAQEAAFRIYVGAAIAAIGAALAAFPCIRFFRR